MLRLLLLVGLVSCAPRAAAPLVIVGEAPPASAAEGVAEAAPRRSTLRPFPTGAYTAFVDRVQEDSCSQSFASTTTLARITLTVDRGAVRMEVRGTQRSLFGPSPLASGGGSVDRWERVLDATLDGRQRLGARGVELSLAEGTVIECDEGPVDLTDDRPAGAQAHDRVAGFVCKLGREFASMDAEDAAVLASIGDQLVFGLAEPLTVSVHDDGQEVRRVRRPDDGERALLDGG